MKALLAEAGANSCSASAPETVKASNVLLLATPWAATISIVEGLGDLSGKVLLDATNPLGAGFKMEVGHTDSGGEMVARAAKGARAVKIFNTTGFNNMADSNYGSQKPAMFYAGDDAEAKKVGAQLASELGFEPIDCGPLSQARLLEPLACVWIDQAAVRGAGRDIAFALLRR
jgi:predicted dinucleotide-binding enzyme